MACHHHGNGSVNKKHNFIIQNAVVSLVVSNTILLLDKVEQHIYGNSSCQRVYLLMLKEEASKWSAIP